MIHQSSLTFLKDLKANNNREWFLSNRDRFDAAKQDMENAASKLINHIAAFDTDVADLEASKTLFRQYRDVRFSADKTPYKIHMGAFFNKGGNQINNAGYYLHVEPGKSLYAGGFWMPEGKDLAAIRQEIDYNFDEWTEITTSKSFRKYFPSGIDKKESLKRQPKGYEITNPAIETLKLKSFTALTPIPDKTLTAKGFEEELAKAFKAVSPMVKFLNRAIE